MKRLIFLQLNEVSFDYVSRYLAMGVNLPGFKRLMERGVFRTASEEQYEHLEPWIQWYSAHTGLTYNQHNVFRLGDGARAEHETVLKDLENQGVTVGSISAMNLANTLQSPAFFIPDPWTDTPSDGTLQSRWMTAALRQVVNDNAKNGVKISSIIKLSFCLAAVTSIKTLMSACVSALYSLGDRTRKAMWLDKVLFEIFRGRYLSTGCQFGVLFLNGVAHVQHHFFHTSSLVDTAQPLPKWYTPDRDCLLDAYKVYDEIISEALSVTNTELIVATGLSQEPYPTPVYYYRLCDHADFLRTLHVKYNNVLPRMTRDFLVTFDDNASRDHALDIFSQIELNGIKFFEEIEVRETELFVTLTYPRSIEPDDVVTWSGKKLPVADKVVFVALKNGHHKDIGYVSTTSPVISDGLKNGAHVASLKGACERYFTEPFV